MNQEPIKRANSKASHVWERPESRLRRVSVSLVTPAYNESVNIERSVRTFLSALSALQCSFEIIVVDDGSTDNTGEVVAKASGADRRVKAVGYAMNQGKGYALRYGANFASGEYIVVADSDGEISPAEIGSYLDALKRADVAIASKRHIESRVSVPASRLFLSLAYQAFVKLLLGIPVSDTQSGLKAFRADALNKILPFLSVKRYAFDVEVLVVASLLKLRIVELPVVIRLDANFSIRNAGRMLVDTLGIAYRLRMTRWYRKNLKSPSGVYRPKLNW